MEGALLTRNHFLGTLRGECGMLERKIEIKLKQQVEKLGGLALKFTSPGMIGVPDRLVLLPKGKVCFVELKAPGVKPRAIQIKRHKQLRALGFKVYVLDSRAGIDQFIKEVMTL